MTDKQLDSLSEQEFDLYLEEIIEAPPPSDLSNEFKPWHKAMNRILWGTGLTTLTLNFLNLDTILPGIGILLMVLGYRTLRNENKWFKTAYIITIARALWFCMSVFFHSTVITEGTAIEDFLILGTYMWQLPLFISLLALRNGIRAIQRKAGLPPHGGTGLLIWYVAIFLLALVSFQGLIIWVLLIGYIFILRGLYKLSKELDEAGYSVSPAPVKTTDKAITIGYATILSILLAIGYLFFNHYPMNWTPVEMQTIDQTEVIAQELVDLGFPETVLQDMTDDEILACEGATFVLVQVRDYDIKQNRGIGTQEEIDNGKIALITPDQGEANIRFTFIGVKFGEDRERWKLIQHFEWLTDVDFCGTEAIQMWPADRLDGWRMDTDVTGRILYDKEGITYTSDYHFLGDVSYQKSGFLADMIGQYNNHDVFATFSLPEDGTRQRGYLMYDVLEMNDGCIIDSWFNYIHQRSQLQFPVKSAMKYEITSTFGVNRPFQIIQSSLQITTHGKTPGLI